MPLSICRESESGVELARYDDVDDVLTGLAARTGAARLRLLHYVDPYGDTTFNGLQCPDVLADLRTLAADAGTDERKVLKAVETLVAECGRENHQYVKMYGD